MFSDNQIEQLSAPLGSKHVAERKKGNFSVPYIEGWHAISEANRIFGFGNWSRETLEMRHLHDPYQNQKSNWVVSYSARVRITVCKDGMEIVREGSGFGSGFDRDVGGAHESAIKEAETDAMKRALITFGNPFGLALYDKSKANVANGEPEPEVSHAQKTRAIWADRRVGKTVWMGELSAFVKDIESCADIDTLEILLASDGGENLQNECMDWAQSWWDGKDDIEGLGPRIHRRRLELNDIRNKELLNE